MKRLIREFISLCSYFKIRESIWFVFCQLEAKTYHEIMIILCHIFSYLKDALSTTVEVAQNNGLKALSRLKLM